MNLATDIGLHLFIPSAGSNIYLTLVEDARLILNFPLRVGGMNCERLEDSLQIAFADDAGLILRDFFLVRGLRVLTESGEELSADEFLKAAGYELNLEAGKDELPGVIFPVDEGDAANFDFEPECKLEREPELMPSPEREFELGDEDEDTLAFGAEAAPAAGFILPLAGGRDMVYGASSLSIANMEDSPAYSPATTEIRWDTSSLPRDIEAVLPGGVRGRIVWRQENNCVFGCLEGRGEATVISLEPVFNAGGRFSGEIAACLHGELRRGEKLGEGTEALRIAFYFTQIGPGQQARGALLEVSVEDAAAGGAGPFMPLGGWTGRDRRERARLRGADGQR